MPKRQAMCATDGKGRGRTAHILCRPMITSESQMPGTELPDLIHSSGCWFCFDLAVTLP